MLRYLALLIFCWPLIAMEPFLSPEEGLWKDTYLAYLPAELQQEVKEHNNSNDPAGLIFWSIAHHKSKHGGQYPPISGYALPGSVNHRCSYNCPYNDTLSCYTGDDFTTCFLIDAQTGTIKHRIRRDDDPYSLTVPLIISHMNKLVWSKNYEDSLLHTLYDVTTGNKEITFPTVKAPITITNNAFISYAANSDVALWDLHGEGRHIIENTQNTDLVTTNGSGKYILIGKKTKNKSTDYDITIFDQLTRKKVCHFTSHGHRCKPMWADGNHIVLDEDGSIALREIPSRNPIYLFWKDKTIDALTLHHQGTIGLIKATEPASCLKVMDIERKKLLGTLLALNKYSRILIAMHPSQKKFFVCQGNEVSFYPLILPEIDNLPLDARCLLNELYEAIYNEDDYCIMNNETYELYNSLGDIKTTIEQEFKNINKMIFRYTPKPCSIM